jgi:hypothetical protein
MTAQIEIVRYYDSEQSVLYVPERNNLLLSQAKNPLGKMMVVVARRPSIDNEMRGQFDDVLGIQLLRNRFALLAMEAAEKSVQAPIVLPSDVNELEMGGDAVIRTANPAGVRRVDLNIPPGAFTEQALLQQELRLREHVIQKDVLETLMPALSQDKVCRHLWEALTHRSSLLRLFLLQRLKMLFLFVLKLMKSFLTIKRLFVV